MKLHIVIAGFLLASAAIPAAEPALDAKAAFARLKTLAGNWEADTSMGKAQMSIELIAGGTVLVERETSTHMQPMMTMYHLDGDRLILTHYCMAGNQPRMQAKEFDPKTGTFRFLFLDATNLATPDAGHMHNVTLQLKDDRHMVSQWEFFDKGKPAYNEKFEYTRMN